MARTYDIEWLLADAIKTFLDAQLDAATLEDCPVVTWYDPMAFDVANRVVVLPGSGQSTPEQFGSYQFDVTVTVKSVWTQPTLSVDIDNHRAWTSEVRDKLMYSSLASSLNTAAAGTLAIDFVLPARGFSMDTNDNPNYLLSEIRFSVRCRSIT